VKIQAGGGGADQTDVVQPVRGRLVAAGESIDEVVRLAAQGHPYSTGSDGPQDCPHPGCGDEKRSSLLGHGRFLWRESIAS
jgi:hypothetical protein